MSSSLPEEVQIALYRTVPGLENCEFMRTAYAIEYDCIDATQLKLSLEFKNIKGLFGAGQFNGTSGYEEAAAQGLIAGINAARMLQGKEPVILHRSDAYIGVLIDDIVTKGSKEPYRMMTSRAEYRLLLRQDNADERLTPIGHEVGLISDERYERFLKKQELIAAEKERINSVTIGLRPEIQEFLERHHSTPLKSGARLSELLKRPELNYDILAEIDTTRPDIDSEAAHEAAIQIKYEGYIKQQYNQVREFKKLENRLLPEDIDYNDVKGLRLEAAQKLNDIRPLNIGHAFRIAGVSPADISVLMIYLEQIKRASKTEGEE